MIHEPKLASVAADESMREKLGDPAWQRPKGYVWNRPGGPDSITYELLERRTHAAIALSCEFPGPREVARTVPRTARPIDNVGAQPAGEQTPGGTATIGSAYDRFCQERFPLPSEAELSAFEQKIGIVFPDDYRRFILQFNGGYFKEPEIVVVGKDGPHDVLTFLCGLNSSHEEAELGGYLPLFMDNDPPNVFPVGGTALGGLIVLDTAPGIGQGAIFLKPAFEDYYCLADDLPAFFALLRAPAGE
jgi:hypothetical protein